MSYNIYRVPKPSGGYRIIAEPDEATKSISKELLTEIDKSLAGMDHHEDLSGLFWFRAKLINAQHAYIAGKSAKTLVNAIYEFTQDCTDFDIIYIDIKDFFGSITWDQVANIRCLESSFHTYPFRNEDSLKSVWKLIHPEEPPFVCGLGIAQGNPLSPAIANLVCATTLDHTLVFGAVEYFDKHGTLQPIGYKTLTKDQIRAHWGNEFTYLRYCDNIFIVVKKVDCYSRTKFIQALEGACLGLPELESFRLKVQVKGNHQKNIVLGMRLGATRAQLADKKWLRTLFYRIDKLGPECMKHKDIQDRFGSGITYDKFLEKVRGLVAYILSVDPGMEPYIIKHAGEYLYPQELIELKEL